MDREAVLREVHDLAAVGPGTDRRRRRRIGHVLGHAARRIGEVVGVAALHEPGSLLVRDDRLLLAVRPVHARELRSKSLLILKPGHLAPTILERDHVLVQFADLTRLVTPDEIRSIVIINEHRRIDERRSDSKGSPDRIGPRTCGTVRDRDADRIALVAIAADVPVPLAVALDGLGRPRLVILLRPRERLQAERRAVIRPVHHVFGREDEPVLHLEDD